MGSSAKIAISLDREVLRSVEAARARTGETRSALIARALRLLTHGDERAAAVAGYREAYRRCPEGPAQITAARKAARRALAQLPWDES